MNIEEILDMMDEALEAAVALPFAGKKCLVDTDKLKELVEDIRLNMPQEIEKAKSLVNDRKIIINDAKAEADGIIRKAEERAKVLVSQQEITRAAQNKANEIMVTAQQKSKELRVTTNDYVDNMLGRIEELMSHDLTDVKKARAALKGTLK